MSFNQAVIKPNDFYTYTIPLPKKALFGSRRKRFVFSELEKIHPCFGAHNSFDIKLLLKRKKTFAKVVVMDSVVLSRYKNIFPKKLLRTQSYSNSFVFVPVWIKLLKVLFPVLFVLGIVILSFFSSHKKESFVDVEKKSGEINLVKSEQEVLRENNFQIADIISAISVAGGKLSSFSWITDGVNENVNAQVVGCFPEEIAVENLYTKISPVIYDGGVPAFAIAFSQPLNNAYVPTENNVNVLGNSSIINAFRSELLSAPIILLSESFVPFEISFSVLPKNIYKCIDMFCSMENRYGLCVSSFSFYNKSESWHGTISFSEQTGGNLNFMKDVAMLLERFSESVAIKQKNFSQNKSVATPFPEIKKQKIGETRRGDGTVNIYYRLSNGKILVE